MIKLKKQKINNLLNYQPFLKNNYLKKKKFKLKNILFENQILYNNLNLESYVIEFNNYKNIYLPFTLIKIDKISTIAIKYENIILFNYDLTYNILYQFNKIMFQNIFKKKNNAIKGRLLGGNWNNKKIFISILGFIFSMKPLNLNNALNYKKKFYFNKYNKKGFYKKKINSTRLINCYKLKYLNFQVNNINNLNILKKTKKEFSRLSYIQTIIQNQKIHNNSFKKN
uniref:Ymf99 n=1 Tax=Phytophthora agathidicida TaxID=1642459 RepID=A0A8B0KF03_9STRA|nr:ymf99 [Phytophthora agathidicida]QTV76756.1 ymf99 [Phytophthora agathidicida]QTV76795.1 ymf99 [Phytophthora agathidicida]DAD54875.1 TPA_asm: ymf99 [Phytophthora agathidicida]DAD54914.1 TPA_asm: ymf99 [Phytophthora agathidicida]